MSDDEIPKSRVRRAAQLGTLAAGQAVRQVGTRAVNLTRSEEGAKLALERRQLETAEQIVTALGTMKGAAMKIGQVLSFLDVGLVPEEHREEFQRKLAKLRDAAPKVGFSRMRKVVEQDLGEKLEDVFAEFDPEPVAAASIGQVYRARLRDSGREVAVKVQYPGIAAAVRADMQNLGMILKLIKRIAPGFDPKTTGEEIRERIDEELDYELEAQNQRSLARIFAGHPFIYIPDVFTEFSTEHVIVSEFVSGRDFEQVKDLPAEQRNRIGEIVFRFYFGCLYRHRQFSGDPHPGNFILMDDGRVAFIDFGLFKRMSPEAVEVELETQRAACEGDAELLGKVLEETGFVASGGKVSPYDLLTQFQGVTWWYTVDREISLTPDIATQVLIDMSDPRSEYFSNMRHENLPPDHLLGRRMETLTLAVLGQLRASGNWHRITREWVYGDLSTTELGRLEADFYSK